MEKLHFPPLMELGNYNLAYFLWDLVQLILVSLDLSLFIHKTRVKNEIVSKSYSLILQSPS